MTSELDVTVDVDTGSRCLTPSGVLRAAAVRGAAGFPCSLGHGLPAAASLESSSARHGCRIAPSVRMLPEFESGGSTDTALTAAIRPIEAWLWDVKRGAVRTKAPCARCDVQV